MTKISYSILCLMGSLALVTPVTAQSVTGSATVSGNIALGATGTFFNATASNTSANPLTPFTAPRSCEH